MCACSAGGAALQRALIRGQDVDFSASKRAWLDASYSDGHGGDTTTAVRWWLVFMAFVMCCDPLPPAAMMCEFAHRHRYEVFLEDYSVWTLETRPSGRQVSGESMGKYVSTVRGSEAGTARIGGWSLGLATGARLYRSS